MRGPTATPGPTRGQVDQLAPPPTRITYPAVIPKATLHYPGADLSPESHVALVVDVESNVDLEGVRVSIRQRAGNVTSPWHPATWQDTKANTGTAVTEPMPIIRINPRGRSLIHVDVKLPTVAGVHILNAGRFIAAAQ